MPLAVQIICAVVGIPALLISVLLYLIRPGRRPAGCEWFGRWDYAHRGLFTVQQRPPENSLAAFTAARVAGYGFELDVRMTADRQVIVFHDETLQRLCGVEDLVRQKSYASLASLPLAESDQFIPLLSAVLALTDKQVPIIVEIKPAPRRRILCAAVAAVLDSYDGPFAVQSFDPLIVCWFRRHRPWMLRGQLAGRRDGAAHNHRIAWFLLRHLLVHVISRPHFVAYRVQDANGWMFRLCRYGGVTAIAWTVRNAQDFAAAMRHFDTMIFEPWSGMSSRPHRRENASGAADNSRYNKV